MAIVNTFECDVCHQQKTTNSWWKVFLLDMNEDQSPAGLLILRWEVDEVERPKQLGGGFLAVKADSHVCGAKCLQEFVSKSVHSHRSGESQTLNPDKVLKHDRK